MSNSSLMHKGRSGECDYAHSRNPHESVIPIWHASSRRRSPLAPVSGPTTLLTAYVLLRAVKCTPIKEKIPFSPCVPEWKSSFPSSVDFPHKTFPPALSAEAAKLHQTSNPFMYHLERITTVYRSVMIFRGSPLSHRQTTCDGQRGAFLSLSRGENC